MLVSRRTRSTSATDQAWKGQPVAACGAAPSAVSETDPEAPLAEVRLDAGEDAVDGRAGSARRVDVRAEQPPPDGSLVIRGVALGGRAAVALFVAWVVGSERAQAERRQERAPADVDNGSRGVAAQRRSGQRRLGKELVRAHRRSSPPGPSTTSYNPPPSARTNRALNDAAARSCSAICPRRRARRSRARSPSTGLRRVRDRRAVRARPSTSTPSRPRPAARSPSAARSTDIPYRVPSMWCCTICSSTGASRSQGRRRRLPRRGGRARAQTTACRRRCCTRATPCQRCSRASPRRRWRPRCAAPRDPRRAGSSRDRDPRRTSSGHATIRRTTDSRRPRSGARRS